MHMTYMQPVSLVGEPIHLLILREHVCIQLLMTLVACKSYAKLGSKMVLVRIQNLCNGTSSEPMPDVQCRSLQIP